MPVTDNIDSADLKAELELLRAAATEAGRIAMGFFRQSPEVWFKGGNSPVSEADYAADHYLRDTLLAARPDYGWLSEETADNPDRLGARRTFVVDPIDGTRGFVEGRTAWCVSVAVVENGRSLAGVLECPARNETYWAVAGGGAFLNGAPLEVREMGERIRIAGPKPMIDGMPAEWQDRLDREAYIPSLAYRVAMIANGALDATFVKPNAHDWDIAAAELILTEAGGKLLDRHGNKLAFAGSDIVHGALMAGSGTLLDVMAEVIARYNG
ncbi:3'(2'),5'-bisphosphate nucleotidase CysQ [Aminobacter anthyllidis]|uniref:3'(2'),5'-bisphosphate nucleotidase CysQ n=1 Tax=Aminobacter anthyllidis TaxID=1035067 RepID=A0A9X1A801_9HYPH|nr:3'(2'),5'-bisphosphate nucleotidase CysQ [Aminobacter anthyllidis]MBT1155046.1 3'(2'),5'-bisphosphate nucleotidase CysQ [Aminobacter anthyllidis]